MDHKTPAATAIPLPADLVLPLEVRVHGRGGQGGVTCAKLIAALFTQMGCYVQTFGDYGSERSGAPVQAYTRIDRNPIKNANKVYSPNHLLVLDEGLIGPNILNGAEAGALLLLNSHHPPASFSGRFDHYRFGVVDATAIASDQGIGSASVVIINTTILGAYARLLGLPLKALEQAYQFMGVGGDIAAAEIAYEKVAIVEPLALTAAVSTTASPVLVPQVEPTLAHTKDIPATLKTGTWSNQAPVYGEHPAPCNVACPAGNDIVGFVQALKKDGADAAAAILLRTQPLPSVCGRVCPAPCMTSCNRMAFDGAVNIRSLERFVGDNATFEPARQTAARPLHVAVIGGGPAGLSAAYQLACHGHDATIYEAGPALGGVLRNGIPAFRLPDAALQDDLDRILSLGITARCNTSIGKDDLKRLAHDHDAVIVAVGFGAAVSLGIKGENLSGVEQGLDFLDRAKRETVALSGDVVVVGGGNTAIDCARTALRCGASSVKIVYRRGRQDMPAIREEIRDAEREGVQVLVHRQPVGFDGEGHLQAITIAEVDAGPPDVSGRRRPVVSERTAVLSCDKVFLALGQDTTPGILADGWVLKDGRVWQGDKILPVWFAGDCATADGTVTHAIGDGRRAALSVMGHQDIARIDPGNEPVAPGHIRFDHFAIAEPHADREIHPVSLAGNFTEVNAGLADTDEANRCFSCGHCTLCDTCLVSCPDGVIFRTEAGYRIDQAYCKGCGMCVAECPRNALQMQDKGVPA